MQLETINKLYLELSQVATAETAKELELKKQVADLQETLAQAEFRACKLCHQIEASGASKQLTRAGFMSSDLHKHIHGHVPKALLMDFDRCQDCGKIHGCNCDAD